MKTKISALLLCIIMIVSLVSCNNTTEAPDETSAPNETKTEETTKQLDGIWADATYNEDKEFGDGKKTIRVEVKADDKSVTFTIKTDSETLGDALFEHSLIEGEKGPYGLYIKKVNGIEANYDKDQTYWLLTKNGEYMMTGVDSTSISDGEHYELTRTK